MDRYIYFGLLVCLLVAGGLSLFASPDPDGLERVAEDKGFIEHGEVEQVMASPFPDYAVSGIGSETLSGSLAGLIGVVIAFALAFFLGKALSKKAS